MIRIAMLMAVLATAVLSACHERGPAAAPPPHHLTAAAVGNYCGMNLLEHPGPKGQIILESRIEPVWFSSARDAFAFTMLPEEPKDIRAIYVSDMARAPNWDNPGPDNWIEARKAVFVIGSRLKGGMGADETVPFSDRAAAERFAAENGGRVVTFDEVPRDYVLGSADSATAAAPQHPPAEAAGKPGHAH